MQFTLHHYQSNFVIVSWYVPVQQMLLIVTESICLMVPGTELNHHVLYQYCICHAANCYCSLVDIGGLEGGGGGSLCCVSNLRNVYVACCCR